MKFLFLYAFGAIAIVSCTPPDHVDTSTSRVLWSQQDTSHNNYRIPSLIATRSGTLLAFAEGRDGGDAGDIDMLLRRSTDNGRSWEDQQIVWDDGQNTCGNPCPVVDMETGRIFLLMTWNLGSDHEHDIIRRQGDSTRVPFVTYSDDDGLTWSRPRNLYAEAKDPNWGWYATGPGVGIQIKEGPHAGRLVIPCNNSYDDPDNTSRDGFGYGAHVLLSDDGGENWRMSKIITPEVNESQVVELSGGRLMMNMRSYHAEGIRALAFSEDGGESWSDVTHHPQLIEPVCQGSTIRYGAYEDQALYLFANPSVQRQRSHMTLKASLDEGQSWSNAKLVYEGPSAYSCLARLPNGNVGLFFEMGERSPYEQMVFLSFPVGRLFEAGTVIDD